MKKIFIFPLFFSFVFPCFSDGLFYCPSVPVYSGTSVTLSSRSVATNSFDSVQLAIANISHAVRIDNRTGSTFIQGSNGEASTGPSILAFICSVDSGRYYNSYQYSILNSLDSICYQLWLSGFQSPGISYQATSGNFSYFNIQSLSVISEALVSTNTLWRSSVLDGLSSLSSSVRELVLNSSSGLSSLSSLLSSSSSIDSSVSNLVSSFSVLLDRVHSDPFLSDFTNSLNSLSREGFLDPSTANIYLNVWSGLPSSFDRSIFSIVARDEILSSLTAPTRIKVFTDELSSQSANLSLIGQYFNSDVVDALIGDYDDLPSRGSKSVSSKTSIKSQLKSWREQAKKQLEDWKVDLSKQLEDWKTSDESGYLNVRNSISNNFETTRKDSNGNDSHEYFIEHLDRTWNDSNHFISNSFDHIFEIYYQNISNTIMHIFDSAGAIPVEIKEPIDGGAVLVRDPTLERFSWEFMNVMSNFTDLVFSQPIHVQMTNSFDNLDEWLKEWRKWVDEDTFYELSQSFYDFKTNALPFFADYYYSFLNENWNFYSSAFDIVRNSSHSNVLERLCFYGLSTDPENGNFFNLFTSFVLLQSEIAASFLDAKDLVDDLSSSSSWFDGLSPFSAARKVSDSIPSKSQIEEIVSTSTDGTNLVNSSFAELLSSFSLMTNLHSRAFDVFTVHSSSSLPDSIVLFRLRTSSLNSASAYQDVSIPVGTIPNVWLLVRLSVAFGICIVNLILFPKFLLKLALLFMPLFKKSLPFLRASS